MNKLGLKSGIIKTTMIVMATLTLAGALILPLTSHADETPLVDEKYSLKADRAAFDKLRKDIPAEVRKENDEKAFMDNMMGDLSRSPADVRNKFSSIISKKRDLFSKDMNKTREEFSKNQTKNREAFSKKQADARKDFAKSKSTSDERTEFFGKLETERRDFYTDQQEKRASFEETMRDKRKDFDDYIRAKTDEFNQLHRDYTKRYEENRTALAAQKKEAADKQKNLQKDIDKEYDAVKKQNATPLESGE